MKEKTSLEEVPNWVVVSPHSDDVAFSIGGIVLKYRQRQRLSIWNIFSSSNYSAFNEYGNDPIKVTTIRKLEESLYAERLGANVVFWDFDEAPLRTGSKGNEVILESIMKRCSALIKSFSERTAIFFPLSIGGNEDHVLLNRAMRELAITVPNEFVEYYLYEDLPYAALFEGECEFLIDESYRNGFELSPILIRIDRYLEAKVEMLLNYKSQCTEKYIDAIRRYATTRNSSDPGVGYECIWKCTINKSRYV